MHVKVFIYKFLSNIGEAKTYPTRINAKSEFQVNCKLPIPTWARELLLISGLTLVVKVGIHCREHLLYISKMLFHTLELFPL